jgi:hypothetical protein
MDLGTIFWFDKLLYDIYEVSLVGVRMMSASRILAHGVKILACQGRSSLIYHRQSSTATNPSSFTFNHSPLAHHGENNEVVEVNDLVNLRVGWWVVYLRW